MNELKKCYVVQLQKLFLKQFLLFNTWCDSILQG